MPRHQLSDAEWEQLRDLLPPERPPQPGHPWKPHRPILDAIFWILASGAPWRDWPDAYQPWQTVSDRFARWQRDGPWERIMERLQACLRDDGQLDLDLWCVDGSVVRAQRAAAGAKQNGGTRPSRPTTPWGALRGASAPSCTS